MRLWGLMSIFSCRPPALLRAVLELSFIGGRALLRATFGGGGYPSASAPCLLFQSQPPISKKLYSHGLWPIKTILDEPLTHHHAKVPPRETVQRRAVLDVNSDNEEWETIVAPERTSDDLRDLEYLAWGMTHAALRDRQLNHSIHYRLLARLVRAARLGEIRLR